MLLVGILEDHISNIDQQAEEMLDRLTKQIAEEEGINEHLKADDQMAWVGATNSIHARAEAVVYKQLIYN